MDTNKTGAGDCTDGAEAINPVLDALQRYQRAVEAGAKKEDIIGCYAHAENVIHALGVPEVADCETCGGVGTIDERLGGYSFSNPEATCPDCDGTGEGPAGVRVHGEGKTNG